MESLANAAAARVSGLVAQPPSYPGKHPWFHASFQTTPFPFIRLLSPFHEAHCFGHCRCPCFGNWQHQGFCDCLTMHRAAPVNPPPPTWHRPTESPHSMRPRRFDPIGYLFLPPTHHPRTSHTTVSILSPPRLTAMCLIWPRAWVLVGVLNHTTPGRTAPSISGGGQGHSCAHL